MVKSRFKFSSVPCAQVKSKYILGWKLLSRIKRFKSIPLILFDSVFAWNSPPWSHLTLVPSVPNYPAIELKSLKIASISFEINVTLEKLTSIYRRECCFMSRHLFIDLIIVNVSRLTLPDNYGTRRRLSDSSYHLDYQTTTEQEDDFRTQVITLNSLINIMTWEFLIS